MGQKVNPTGFRTGIMTGAFYAPDTIHFSQVVAAAGGGLGQTVATLLSIAFTLNLLLCVFNLIPLPPLDGGESVDVRVIGGGMHVMEGHATDGVTIISGEPLDDSVKESIRSVLISAGHDDEVQFIDGSGDGEHVRVIKKRIEIEQ